MLRERARLGDELVKRLRRESSNAALLWALGRLGARTPLVWTSQRRRFARRGGAVDPGAARVQADHGGRPPSALTQLAALTGDPARDVAPDVRQRIVDSLLAAGVQEHALTPLREIGPASRIASHAFGEPLPEGLRLEPAPARRCRPRSR